MTRAKDDWESWKKVLYYTSNHLDLDKAHDIVLKSGFYKDSVKPQRSITGNSKYLLESSTGDVIITNDLQLIEKLFSLPKKRLLKAVQNGSIQYRGVTITPTNSELTDLSNISNELLETFFDPPKGPIPVKVINPDGSTIFYNSVQEAAKAIGISSVYLRRLASEEKDYFGTKFELKI